MVLNRYLVSYFGNRFVTSIDYKELQCLAKWPADNMGREPMASTLNNHDPDLNRIFEEAAVRGYMTRSHVPVLINKGRDSIGRPNFFADEYRMLIQVLPSWIDKGREGKSGDMRHLMHNYVLTLANTGI